MWKRIVTLGVAAVVLAAVSRLSSDTQAGGGRPGSSSPAGLSSLVSGSSTPTGASAGKASSGASAGSAPAQAGVDASAGQAAPRILVDAGKDGGTLNDGAWRGINAWSLASLKSYGWLWSKLHQPTPKSVEFQYARITTIFSAEIPIYHKVTDKTGILAPVPNKVIVNYDASGKPDFWLDFTEADAQIESAVSAGLIPQITFNQIPWDLSSVPYDDDGVEIVQNDHDGDDRKFVDSGSPYAPTDFGRWRALIGLVVSHWGQIYHEEGNPCRDIRCWYFEAWNEPDSTEFWQGDNQPSAIAQEAGAQAVASPVGTYPVFFKLYDYTAAGVGDAEERLRDLSIFGHGDHVMFGGPGVSRGDRDSLLEQFLDHVSSGASAVPDVKGVRCDFVSYHNYAIYGLQARTQWYSVNSGAIKERAEYVRDLVHDTHHMNVPLLMTEWNIDGTAAYPGLETQYDASFSARVMKDMMDLGKGTLDVAFYTAAYGQNYYTYFVNDSIGGLGLYWNTGTSPGIWKGGVAMPAARTFELVQSLCTGTQRVKATDEAGKDLTYPIGAIATLDAQAKKANVLVYHHEDNDITVTPVGNYVPNPGATVTRTLEVRDLPFDLSSVHVIEERVDAGHANSLTKWVEMGKPSPDQLLNYYGEVVPGTDHIRLVRGVEALQEASQVKPVEVPFQRTKDGKGIQFPTVLPEHSVVLYEIQSGASAQAGQSR